MHRNWETNCAHTIEENCDSRMKWMNDVVVGEGRVRGWEGRPVIAEVDS